MSLQQLISAPLVATIDADAMSAERYMKHFMSLAFESYNPVDGSTGALRLISFNFTDSDASGGAEKKVSVPLVSLVTLPLLQIKQADFDFAGYTEFWNSAEKKGYAGTAIFTKTEPLNVTYGIGDEQFDCEGRVICAEFPEFYLVTVYTPNAQKELVRIDFRMAFEDKFRAYLERLHETKPVIVCGDMNVAHRRIDIKNAKPNIGSAGFSYEERGKFSELLAAGFVDSFRELYPDAKDAYSWWSYMGKAREKNVGWRIDYHLVNPELAALATGFQIDRAESYETRWSDHAPLTVTYNLP